MAWVASALALSLAVSVVAGTGAGTVGAAWRIVVREDFTTRTALRAQLLLAAVDFAASLVGLLVAGGVAVATFLTVREMRSSRLQAVSVELARAESARLSLVADEGWLLIGECQLALAKMNAVAAAVRRASRFGRVPKRLEAPLLQQAFAAFGGVSGAVVSAQRLATTPGPWAEPAERLAELLLLALDDSLDSQGLLSIAEQAATPLAELKKRLPGGLDMAR